MHIVIATDSNPHYIKQCFVMLYSLFKHNTEVDIHLHVFHTYEAKALFEQKREYMSHFVSITQVQLQYYEISRKTIEDKGLMIYNNLPLTTYFRLLIPSLLDPSIEQCVYLDTDMIIRGSIVELTTKASGTDIWLAGVKTNILTEYIRNIDVQEYINAGVLVIDIPKRRSYAIADQIIQFINQYPQGIHHLQAIMGDQCGINAVCAGHIEYLDPKRNCTPFWFNTAWISAFQGSLGYTPEVILEATQHPIILHFAGTHKPCDWICFHPRKLVYYRYCLLSGSMEWSDFRKVVRHGISYPFIYTSPLYKLIRELKLALK